MSPRGAITAGYALAGVLNALWGATLPATDARLDLGPGRLGVVLMVLAVGALVAMSATGWLVERRRGRHLLRAAAPTASLALIGPAAASSVSTLAISAALLGVLLGTLNVVLTVRAVAVERAAGRPIMARVHGAWTLGAVGGGVLVAAGLRLGIDARALLVAGAVTLALAVLAVDRGPHQVAAPSAGGDTGSPGPVPGPGPGLLIALGAIGAAAFLTEGAATDWAGVHATRVLGTDPATASAGYLVFFSAMAAVRFVGDALRARLGAATTLRVAGATATTGYALVLLAGALPRIASGPVACALTGWALAGAGMAMVWPVVTSTLGAAGARRLSAVTTISYGGGLVGPALIGYVADQATLSAALLIPAALALVIATVAPAALQAILRPPPRTGDPRQRPRRGRPAKFTSEW